MPQLGMRKDSPRGATQGVGVMGPFCTIAVVGDSPLHVSNPQRVNLAVCELKDTSEAMG